ncbi:cyclic lactone autoinducer peptide [Paenibacillus silvisoli]|nr:cyclic lactone autoinducer peptide [Paenibacillus silvisoli]
MKQRILYKLATVMALGAVLIVSTASWAFIHQPETPEELLK